MSWQLAAVVLLALALAAASPGTSARGPPRGWSRSWPRSAALAAVGRIAFAPLPNVKPTTDIVLVSGLRAWAARPASSSARVAALASNLFFGQGPWTPWQMARLGPGGPRRRGRSGGSAGARPGRGALALACAARRHRLYGAIVDFSHVGRLQRQHSSAPTSRSAGTSLPFDLAHAVGNVVFALAFGPALLRALARFRARFEVTWRSAAATGVGGARARGRARGGGASPRPRAAAARLAGPTCWRAQNADGGWGAAPGRRLAPRLYTAWAALGPRRRRAQPARRASRGTAPPWTTSAARSARRPKRRGRVERTSSSSTRRASRHATSAAATSSPRFCAPGAPTGPSAGRSTTSPSAILALRAAGRRTGADALRRRAARWLARQQNTRRRLRLPAPRRRSSDVDDTGAALQALVAAGRRRSASRDAGAVRYLAAASTPTAASRSEPGRRSNAQSTAWAVQGLVATRRDPARVRAGTAGASALAYLRSLVGPDGAVRYSRTSRQTPVWVTAQALSPFAPARSRCRACARRASRRSGEGRGPRGGTLSLDQAAATGGPAGGADARADRTPPPCGKAGRRNPCGEHAAGPSPAALCRPGGARGPGGGPPSACCWARSADDGGRRRRWRSVSRPGMRVGVPKGDGARASARRPRARGRRASWPRASHELVRRGRRGRRGAHPRRALRGGGGELGDPWGRRRRHQGRSAQRRGGRAAGRGSVLVGFLAPLTAPDVTRALADAGLTAFAMEAIPRISRAQSMDALSSQSNVGRLQGGPAGRRALRRASSRCS